MGKSNQKTIKVEADRKVYARPNLKTFGPVSALTQGGTGPTVEGMMGMAPMMQMV